MLKDEMNIQLQVVKYDCTGHYFDDETNSTHTVDVLVLLPHSSIHAIIVIQTPAINNWNWYLPSSDGIAEISLLNNHIPAPGHHVTDSNHHVTSIFQLGRHWIVACVEKLIATAYGMVIPLSEVQYCTE